MGQIFCWTGKKNDESVTFTFFFVVWNFSWKKCIAKISWYAYACVMIKVRKSGNEKSNFLIHSMDGGKIINNFKNNEFRRGAIQIICDTQWWSRGPGSTKCHVNFFCFLNSDLKAFWSKKSSLIIFNLFHTSVPKSLRK